MTTTSSRQPAGAGNPRVSVAWMIHAYRKPEFVVRLVERLYQPGDSVWIHYDRKAPPGDVVRISRELSRFPQCHIFREVRVSWGGIESVASDLLLCDRLLESEIDFDFVVHLTGSTYPIKNPQRLRFFLADNRARSFLRTSPRPALIEQRPTVEALHLEADEGVEEEHGLARRYLFARGHFGTDRNRPYAARRNIPDLFTLIRRARFDFHLNILRVRKRSAMLQGRPRDVFLPRTFHQIFRGFVHDMICREHFLAVHRSPLRPSFVHELKYASVPDEVFYHTMLRNLVPEHELTNDHYLYTLWRTRGGTSPDDLGEEHIPSLRASNAFFARKFEDWAVLDRIDCELLQI